MRSFINKILYKNIYYYNEYFFGKTRPKLIRVLRFNILLLFFQYSTPYLLSKVCDMEKTSKLNEFLKIELPKYVLKPYLKKLKNIAYGNT